MARPNTTEGFDRFLMNVAIGRHIFTFTVGAQLPIAFSAFSQSINTEFFNIFFWQQDPKTDFIRRLQDDLLNQIKSTKTLETIEFHPIEDLHLSLTRTVVLQHHWIDEFVRSVEQKLKNTNRYFLV